jgi:hypothetical protein
VSNADQVDQNHNGVGDACDPDIDGDGVLNALDSCPLVSNADQVDQNHNGVGDACDPDIDGDGVLNALDSCPLVSNADQVDQNHNGIGDACDPAFPDVSAPTGRIVAPRDVAVGDPAALELVAADEGAGWDAAATVWSTPGQRPQQGPRASFVFQHPGPSVVTVRFQDLAGNSAQLSITVAVYDVTWRPLRERRSLHRFVFTPIVIRDAPTGALVQLDCQGTGCSCGQFTTQIRGSKARVGIAGPLRNRMLDFGATVTLRVTYPEGEGGKEWSWRVGYSYPSLRLNETTRLMALGANWGPGLSLSAKFQLSLGIDTPASGSSVLGIGPFKLFHVPLGSTVAVTCLTGCAAGGRAVRLVEPMRLVQEQFGHDHRIQPTRYLTLEVTAVAPGVGARTILYRVSATGKRELGGC